MGASVWSLLLVFGCGTLTSAAGGKVRLDSPPDGARPHSAYVVVEGEAAASSTVQIWDGGARAATVQTDGLGHFERVLRLAAGAHQLRVQCGDAESAAHVEVGSFAATYFAAPYELLQSGDVILAHDRSSQQDELYRPRYTHSAMYIGPGNDGAPLLFEAVSEDNATRHGPVAALTIEESLVGREADRVDLFRLAEGLSAADRGRILTWARATAARGLPFQSTGDFGDLYRAWLLWDAKSNQPRDAAEFQRILDGLRERLLATNAYDCATLVWHAYRDNTAERIDLASPNRLEFAGAAPQASKGFVAALASLLILPDSFALSGKLRRVTAP